MFEYIFVKMYAVNIHMRHLVHMVGSAKPPFTRGSLFIEIQGHSLSDMVLQGS